MAVKEYDYYLFDLDGTVTQSEFGIIESAVYALEKLGIPTENKDELKKFIGPPLYITFHDLYGLPEKDAEQGVEYFREYYNDKGIYNAPLYPGVADTLKALKAAGKKLAIATSKPKPLADIVIKHSGLWDTFDAVIGPAMEKKNPSKVDQIQDAMAALSVPADAHDRVLMVGDRFYDIEAAVTVGVDSAGALYGYGSRKELEDAGATFLIEGMEELLG